MPPAFNPALSSVVMDALKNLMRRGQGGAPFKPEMKPQRPLPMMPFKPAGPPFLPPVPPPRPQMNPAPRPGPNDGILMNMPMRRSGPRGFPRRFNHVYCPPGPTSSDTCKDQKLYDFLYFPNGDPRYDWVGPANPFDPTSISDNVKDMAQDILVMKVRSRANPVPSAKEWELMTLLGDPKDGTPFSPRGRFGPRIGGRFGPRAG